MLIPLFMFLFDLLDLRKQEFETFRLHRVLNGFTQLWLIHLVAEVSCTFSFRFHKIGKKFLAIVMWM